MSNLVEEIGLGDEDSTDSDDNIESETDNPFECQDLNIQIDTVKKGFQIGISHQTAANLYESAGSDNIKDTNEVKIFPQPHILTTSEEAIILATKDKLGIKHDLDEFQVQSLVALYNGRSVILLAPTGSEKTVVTQIG